MNALFSNNLITFTQNNTTMSKTFTVVMKRTYETTFEIEAETEAEAIEKVEGNGDRYTEELNQCNCTDQDYFIEK